MGCRCSLGIEVPVFIAAHSRIESRAPFALRTSKPGCHDEEGSNDIGRRTSWCRGVNQLMPCALVLPGRRKPVVALRG